MADSFVLRNGGDYVLRNGGDRILRNPIVIVVEKPTISISHVTLDAGVDLRENKKPRKRQKQVLTLSIEIPVHGKSTYTKSIPLELEGTVRASQSLSLDASIPLILKPHNIPLYIPITSIQKTLFSTIGEKSYNHVMRKTIIKHETKSKIDTLKEALRMLDEDL
jgi:hypothetical protein